MRIRLKNGTVWPTYTEDFINMDSFSFILTKFVKNLKENFLKMKNRVGQI